MRPSPDQPITDSQQWKALTYPTPLKVRPVVDVDKIQRMRGLFQDRRKGEPPYSVDEYIWPGNEVGLLDSKRVAAMQREKVTLLWCVTAVVVGG